MEAFLAAVLVVGFVGTTIYGIRSLNEAMQLRCVTSTSTRVNDDSVTETEFLKLLGEARESMIIYDDGNDMDNSIYKSSAIVEAVRQKMDGNPNFQMRCLFNSDEQSLLFRAELAGLSGVEIRTLDRNASRMKTHYKIIDRGLKAYLSQHDLGERARLFKFVDCSKVPPAHFDYVSNVVLGQYKDHFEQSFSFA